MSKKAIRRHTSVQKAIRRHTSVQEEIKRHTFVQAKDRLREFSEKTEAKLEIDRVRTDGGILGLGDHKVTGDELNQRLETIQEYFIAVNTTNNKVIKEFREVYNVLDLLDEDYIKSIVANLKAVEKTSNDVRVQQKTLKRHHEKLAEQQSKLDAHQAEIEKNIENISKIVTILRNFKEKLEYCRHLADIDKIWNDCNAIQKDIQVVSDNLNANITRINELVLADDKMRESIDSNTCDINILKEYKDKLSSISHLDDVDSIWKDAEDHTSQLIEAEKRDDELATAIQKNKDEADKIIADAVHTTNTAVESLKKRIKYAYWIAGGSVGIAIIQFILLLLKVI